MTKPQKGFAVISIIVFLIALITLIEPITEKVRHKQKYGEFDRYIGMCKYTKCTHTKEDGCAILAALERGEIAKSRHDSFLSIYETLKNKPTWEKPQEMKR